MGRTVLRPRLGFATHRKRVEASKIHIPRVLKAFFTFLSPPSASPLSSSPSARPLALVSHTQAPSTQAPWSSQVPLFNATQAPWSIWSVKLNFSTRRSTRGSIASAHRFEAQEFTPPPPCPPPRPRRRWPRIVASDIGVVGTTDTPPHCLAGTKSSSTKPPSLSEVEAQRPARRQQRITSLVMPSAIGLTVSTITTLLLAYCFKSAIRERYPTQIRHDGVARGQRRSGILVLLS